MVPFPSIITALVSLRMSGWIVKEASTHHLTMFMLDASRVRVCSGVPRRYLITFVIVLIGLLYAGAKECNRGLYVWPS